jgi:hypothetical protein
MARLATGASYDAVRGELLRDGEPRCYVSSDNLKWPGLVGRRPAEVIAAVRRAGLSFEAATGTGVTLHLLGAVPRYGKLGAVCVERTASAAGALNERLADALTALAAAG